MGFVEEKDADSSPERLGCTILGGAFASCGCLWINAAAPMQCEAHRFQTRRDQSIASHME